MTDMTLDPEFASILAAMAGTQAPSILTGDIAQMRGFLSAISPQGGPPMAQVEDSQAGGVPVRGYWPTEAVRGRIVLFHGGGWVLGGVADYDHFARTLAVQTGCQVLSVDYRLAPEHPFPAAVEDAWAVIRSITDDGPLFVAGDSAGGNLSAVVTHLARDHGGPRIDGQILIYPSVAGDADSAGMRAFVPPMMQREEIAAYYDLYVPARADRRDIRFAPLSGRLDDLPPALVVAAGADLFTAEATLYANALGEAGVPVVVHHQPGVPHAYLTLFPGTQAAIRTMSVIGDFVAACIAAGPAVDSKGISK